jgi:hypothetical protein
LEGNIAEEFFAQVLGQARRAELLSDEHFSVVLILEMTPE